MLKSGGMSELSTSAQEVCSILSSSLISWRSFFLLVFSFIKMSYFSFSQIIPRQYSLIEEESPVNTKDGGSSQSEHWV